MFWIGVDVQEVGYGDS